MFNGIINAINNYRLQCMELISELKDFEYNEGLIHAIQIICKIWGDGKSYVYNQNSSLEAFCINNGFYNFLKNVPTFPYTRKFHVLRFLGNILLGIPLITKWFNIHQVCLTNLYI